jgi:uncharacterized cupredoxin-like copper-binding protein
MRRIVAIGVVALGITIAGCGGGSDDHSVIITISAKNVKFVPDAVTVPTGKLVTITLKNLDEDTEHDFEVEDLEATVIEGGSEQHGGGTQKVAVHMKPGGTSSITFRADKAGTYKIVCTVDGHADAGMIGELTVT